MVGIGYIRDTCDVLRLDIEVQVCACLDMSVTDGVDCGVFE